MSKRIDWINELTDGGRMQSKGYLYDYEEGDFAGNCCLGVLIDMHGATPNIGENDPADYDYDYDDYNFPQFYCNHIDFPGVPLGEIENEGFLPEELFQRLSGIKIRGVNDPDWNPSPSYNNIVHYLAHLNDNGKSFAEIAEYLEYAIF
jgi:hypothetical protein